MEQGGYHFGLEWMGQPGVRGATKSTGAAFTKLLKPPVIIAPAKKIEQLQIITKNRTFGLFRVAFSSTFLFWHNWHRFPPFFFGPFGFPGVQPSV